MNHSTSVNSTPAPSASPPAWFRYGVVAVATLMLCSCRASDLSTAKFAQAHRPAPASADTSKTVFVEDQTVQPASHSQVKGKQTPPDVVPALYEADVNEDLARVQLAFHGHACNCPACQMPAVGSCSCAVESSGAAPRDEYLCDGGDLGTPAAVRKDWNVDGLEQEDTIAHYDTLDGRTVVTPSNRVCVYAPRFGVVRRVVDLHEYVRIDQSGGMEQGLSLSKFEENEEAATSLNLLEPSTGRVQQPSSLLSERQKLGELAQEVEVREFDGSLAPYADLQIIRAGTLSNDQSALLAEATEAAITWSSDQAVQITIDSRRAQADVSLKQPAIVYHQDRPNSPKLRLVKLASTGSARPGEEIEFTLRFDNVGNRVIGNVTIVDNLTTRLEYVPDSATSSVDADFTAIPNLQGSAVMRWEIKAPVEAGAGGILQFKCRVR